MNTFQNYLLTRDQWGTLPEDVHKQAIFEEKITRFHGYRIDDTYAILQSKGVCRTVIWLSK